MMKTTPNTRRARTRSCFICGKQLVRTRHNAQAHVRRRFITRGSRQSSARVASQAPPAGTPAKFGPSRLST